MSLIQINTAIPLAERLLEQEQEQQQEQERRSTDHHHAEHYHGAKFIALGAVTGFFIQIVSLGSYAFLLLHYQPARHTQVGYDDEEADVAMTTTTTAAALMNGFLPHEQQPQSMTYAFLSVLTQVDLVVYVLIWVAFTCTMTRNGMTCIRAQFFDNIDDEDEEDGDDEEVPQVSVTKNHSCKNIKRRYVFLLGVYFLVGIVSGAFLAWSAIDIYLGFPIPFKPILLTVTVDLVLCYCMVRCYDMGKKKKNMKQLAPKNEDDDDEEIDFSSLPSNNRGTEEVLLRRLYDIDHTLMEHVAGSDGVLMEHVAGSEGEFVYVHESPPPPSPGVAASSLPLHQRTVVLQASPPCQRFSSTEKRNTNAHVVHASPPCPGFLSSENMIIVD